MERETGFEPAALCLGSGRRAVRSHVPVSSTAFQSHPQIHSFRRHPYLSMRLATLWLHDPDVKSVVTTYARSRSPLQQNAFPLVVAVEVTE